jgi:hypothetical protein
MGLGNQLVHSKSFEGEKVVVMVVVGGGWGELVSLQFLAPKRHHGAVQA